MPEALTVLLDQNVPRAVAPWLRTRRPQWTVFHTVDVDLSGQLDETLFAWAQRQNAMIITFDEDFADSGRFPLAPTRESFDCVSGPPRSRKLNWRWSGYSRRCQTKSLRERL